MLDLPIKGASRKINYLDASHFERLVAVTLQKSRHPERDNALAHVFFELGLRFPEIAGLRIDDYLNSDGTVRANSVIRQDIAANHKSRTLRWEKHNVILAVDAYLVARNTAGHHVVEGTSKFRGLDPTSNLFLNARGQPFEYVMVVKRQKACKSYDALYAVFKRMFARIGVTRATTSLGRATIAKNMTEQGYARSAIAVALGCTPESVAELLRTIQRNSAAANTSVP